MEQGGLGRTTGAGMTVAEAVALPVERNIDGYESESEESEFSMSDSVHYTDSEFEDDEDSTDAPAAPPASETAVVTVTPQATSRSVVPVVPMRRVTLEETIIVRQCNRNLSLINYGPYRIFFDVEVDQNFLGRIIIHLSNHHPICRNNIDKLCKGNMRRRNQLKMHYSGTKIHKMQHGKFLEGGVLHPLIPQNSETIYEEKPVIGSVNYDSYIMIANKSINDAYSGARFLLTTTANVKHYDAEHIPIGCVVLGTEVIDMLARLPTDENGFFYSDITIAHCGSIKRTRYEQENVSRIEKSSRNYKNHYPYKLQNKLKPKKLARIASQNNPWRHF